MTHDNATWRTASELRCINGALDDTLSRLVAAADDAGAPPPHPEWSVHQVLAHLAEFPHFFAADLRRWQGDRTAVVGRTHDHPQRLAAVSGGGLMPVTVDQMDSRVRTALGDLAQAMHQLSDEDLQAATVNVKYGEEPLAAYLNRYVIDHKTGHIAQLHRLLAGSGPWDG